MIKKADEERGYWCPKLRLRTAGYTLLECKWNEGIYKNKKCNKLSDVYRITELIYDGM